MLPDATSCTALTSALYSTVSEDDVLHRLLKVWSFCSKKFFLALKTNFVTSGLLHVSQSK
jgi:hypothetical protein